MPHENLPNKKIKTMNTVKFDSAASGPLADVRVVDLSRLVSGNMLTHVLADMGADVVKIEHPTKGDDLRKWRVEGEEIFWDIYARNKRSLALDLKSPEDHQVLRRLVRHADALVENFTPGTLEKLGLSPETLLEINPKLVIVRVSGWGQTGKWRDKPGFGTLIEAMSGFAHLNGYPDRPPVLPPLATADMVAGLYGGLRVLRRQVRRAVGCHAEHDGASVHHDRTARPDRRSAFSQQ